MEAKKQTVTVPLNESPYTPWRLGSVLFLKTFSIHSSFMFAPLY